jgi:hypothetical protein
MARYLAVAHKTAESPAFLEAVAAIVADDPDAEFVLVVPATPVEHVEDWTSGEAETRTKERAVEAAKRLEAIGALVTNARAGDAHPYEAVLDALREGPFRRVVVSTLPPGASAWLRMDVINRLRRTVDIPITHVVGTEP